MKKIIFYTDTPILGGAENQMYLLAKFLPREKYRVTLACSSFPGLNAWCQKFMEIGVPVQRLRVIHKHDPRHFLYLKKLMREADMLHLHVWNPASCRYGFLAASGKPLIITEHDPFPLAGVRQWVKKKLMERVSAIIVVSEDAGKIVRAEFPSLANRLHVVPNGIDSEEWKNQALLPNRMEFRRTHFKTAAPEIIILCAAELHKRKGQKYLLQAMRQVLEKYPNAKLVLAGSGPEKKRYQKIAGSLGDRVLFLGKRKDVAQLMAAADLFVLPSIREAFGLVLAEAGLLHLPVIASCTGGIPEIIEHGVSGTLCEAANSNALAMAINSILEDAEKTKSMANNLYLKVKTKFHAQIMADKTALVYDSIT